MDVILIYYQEIFGPILPVVQAASPAEAIAKALVASNVIPPL